MPCSSYELWLDRSVESSAQNVKVTQCAPLFLSGNLVFQAPTVKKLLWQFRHSQCFHEFPASWDNAPFFASVCGERKLKCIQLLSKRDDENNRGQCPPRTTPWGDQHVWFDWICPSVNCFAPANRWPALKLPPVQWWRQFVWISQPINHFSTEKE